jgi:hypothetical protein
MIILQPPTSISDRLWLKQVRNASLNVNEDTMLTNLRKLLPRVNPLDYEKIRFLCTWIMDILMEEDENMNDVSDISIIDSDDLTSGSNHGGLTISMSRKQVCNNSNDNSSTKSSTIMEIDLCRSYIDITSFLSGIVFPIEVINQISSINEIYTNITSIQYLTRVPLWPLINEPWAIIESIMMASSNIASKLYPLCHPLLLNKDEFITRKIKAIYNKKEDNIINKNTSTDKFEIVSELINGISDFKLRLNVWKWLYTKEKGINNIIAEKAITMSLQLLTTSIPVNNELVNVEAIDSLMTSLINDLVSIRCEFTIINLDNKVTNIFNNYTTMASLARFKSSYNNPNILLQNLLEVVISKSWSLQLQSLRSHSEILCSGDIYNQIHTPLVVKYLKYVSVAIKEIILHNSMLTTTEVVKNKEDLNNLESIRHSMIGKFLSDVDNNNTNSKTSSNSSNTTTLWGGGNSTSSLICTLSELRRREDVFLSFSISVLISSCDSIETRSSYITQLNTVYRGQSVKSMRRLTSRSKFRAIQAINFLNIGNEYELLSTITGDKLYVDNFNDSSLLKLDQLKLYLYCLSELQELRLPLSEETLLMSLGLLDNGEINSRLVCNPSPLIKTWIYDEGKYLY